MSVYIGRLADVGLSREATRGVAVPAQYTLPRTNITFDDKANKALSIEGLGNIAGNGAQAIVTQLFSEGNIDGELNVNTFGLLLYALFGSDTPTSFQSTAYKHTFALANTNQHQTLTIFGNDPVADRAYKACMIDNLDIDISIDDIVKYSAGFKGKKGNDFVYTPSYAADFKFVGRDLTFKLAADVASLGAATALSLKELKVSFKANAEFDFVLGTLEPENGLNKQFTIEGSFMLNHEDVTVRNYMLNGTYRAMSILLSQTRDTVGSGGPSLYFEFPVVDFFEWERDRKLDDPVTQKVNFRVLFDVANNRYISSAYIANTVAAYV